MSQNVVDCVDKYKQTYKHESNIPLNWIVKTEFKDPLSRIKFLKNKSNDEFTSMYLSVSEVMSKLPRWIMSQIKNPKEQISKAISRDIAALLFCTPKDVLRFHLKSGKKDREPLKGKTAGRWWDNIGKKKKGKNKWRTITQNGPFLPPPYEPLPVGVKLKFNGKKVNLSLKEYEPLYVSAQEAALFFARRLAADNRLNKPNRTAKDLVFLKNFYKDWATALKKGKNAEEKEIAKYIAKEAKKSKPNFSKIDFSDIVTHVEQTALAKKEMSSEEKKAERIRKKEEKEARDEIYGWCLVDDVSYPVSYAVEIPGIFIGKSGQPKRGMIKKRHRTTDITLNLSPLKNAPKAFNTEGIESKWKDIIADKEATWLAKYTNNVTGGDSYIRLKRSADPWVSDNDFMKFEKARKLGGKIDKIRKSYRKDYKKAANKQLAAAVFLLDKVAIRPGSESKDDSGTTGLTTLICENIKNVKADSFELDFTGKSSIPFKRTIKVDAVDKPVLRILKDSCKGKTAKDQIFPDVTATKLNAYLKQLDGKKSELTAKVFRTWAASQILSDMLAEIDLGIEDDIGTKKQAYFDANLAAAEALNHKSMTDNSAQIQKLKDQITEKEKKEAKTAKQKAAKLAAIRKLKQRLKEKEENISLSTSRVNYMDPRITIAWAKKYEVPIETGSGGAPLMNKTMLENSVWAMETPSTWNFELS